MSDKFDFIRQDVAGLTEAGLFINLRIMDSPADRKSGQVAAFSTGRRVMRIRRNGDGRCLLRLRV